MAIRTKCYSIPNFKSMFGKFRKGEDMVGVHVTALFPTILAGPIVTVENKFAPIAVFKRIADIAIFGFAQRIAITFTRAIFNGSLVHPTFVCHK